MRQILLAEDDPVISEVLTRKFQDQGIEVVSTDRMDLAIELFKSREFEAVITDFHLQQGTGGRLLINLRRIRENVPVFLITGTPFVKEDDFANHDFSGVYIKPFPLDSMVSEVIKACLALPPGGGDISR